MSRKTFRIFLNSYLENFANISNFLFANFADLLDFLQLCHLLNFVCQPCRSFRCGRRYLASRSVSRPSSWGSGCALWECENVVMCDVSYVWCTLMWECDDGEEEEEERGVEAMMIIIVLMMRASFRSWCVTKKQLWWLQWWLNKPVWAQKSDIDDYNDDDTNRFELKIAIMMITMMIEQTGLISLQFVLKPQPLVVPLLTQGYREIVLLTRENMYVSKLINMIIWYSDKLIDWRWGFRRWQQQCVIWQNYFISQGRSLRFSGWEKGLELPSTSKFSSKLLLYW